MTNINNESRRQIILEEIEAVGHISTTNDAFAKKLFSHKDILIDFLNAILQREGENLITDLNYTDTELHAENSYGKISRLDICCTLVSGEQIDIEIQVANEGSWIGRSLFYWSKLYEGTLVKGESYDELKPVICINVLKFNIFTDSSMQEPHTTAKICNMENREPITSLLELHFLELQKFKMKKISEMSRAEKWLAYFSGKLTRKDEATMQSDQILSKAIDIRNSFMKDPENYAAYLNREMEILDYKSMMKQKLEEGRKEGREEGREEGIVHGEEKAEIRILRNMIANGYKTDEALRIMGIPEAQWEALKVKLK